MKGPSKQPIKLPKIDFPDGTHVGGPIPGSKYKRSICAKCREPIRVVAAGTHDLCRDCGISREPNDNPQPGRRETEMNYHGLGVRRDT